MVIYALDSISPSVDGDSTCWIAPNAVVIGNVRFEAEASIWFGAVLRGDNERISIGARSNVQDLCVVHTDLGFPCTIGSGVTVGHRAIIHGATIGNNSLIGMGAVVLNGAQIGENCLIGAHALIPENKIIPDNSLVLGSPGRIMRSLDDTAIAGLKESAARYVANARRFSLGLERVDEMPAGFGSGRSS